MTALASAIERAGGPTPAEAEFTVAIARARNRGVSAERAIELVRAGFELPGEAMSPLPQGQVFAASARQPNDGEEGQSASADSGHHASALSPSAKDDAAGHLDSADGQLGFAPASSLLRRMTLVQQSYRTPDGKFQPRPQSPGAIAAAANAARTAAVTALETFKVRDGRGIGDVYMNEIGELRATSVMEASVLLQIQKHASYDPTTNPKVREVVKVSELQRFIQRAAEVADAS